MHEKCKQRITAVALIVGLLPIGLSAAAVAQNTFAPQVAQAASSSVDAEEWAFLPLINDFRSQNGLGPLQMSAALTTASDWMSSDMATNNYFNHTDSLGRDLKTRLTSFGYSGSMGENIAAGQKSAQEVFTAWKNSPGHRANMLNPDYRVIGVGRVVVAGSQYETYWTTDLGGTVDQVVTPQDTVAQTPSPSPSESPKQQRITRRQSHFRLTVRHWFRLGK